MNRICLTLILIGGFWSFMAIHAQSGYLDPTFGAGGVALPDQISNWRESNMEIQPDGKILLLNTYKFNNSSAKTQISMHRFMPDGALDPGFGNGGTIAIRQDVMNLGALNGAAIKLLANGKILVGYHEYFVPDTITTTVLQFNSDGSPDANFGQNGAYKNADLWGVNVGQLRDLQVQQNGNIVITYYSINSSHYNYGFRLLDANGQALPGNEQINWANTNNRSEIYAKTLIQPDDKILVGGYLASANNNPADKKIILERFNPDATFDAGFGNQGIVISEITPYTDFLTDMLLEPDGHILVCGADLYNRSFFAKYLPNGIPDSSFGTAGIVLRENTTHYYANTIMRQTPDGKLLVTGTKGMPAIGQNNYPSIERLDGNIGPDNTFGPEGKIFLPKDSANRNVIFQDMALLPDRRILVSGYADDDSLKQLLLVRFLPELNAVAWHPDADSDNYGADAGVLFSDQQPQGYVATGGDCDDDDASVNPGATEICGNGKDDNCDGISLMDVEPPVARCVDFLKLNLDSTGTLVIHAQDLDGGSTDDCGTLHFEASQTVFDCSNLFINFVALTVSDNAGNSNTCETIVKINDLIAPTALCRPVINLNLDIDGQAGISVDDVDAGSFDNCNTTNLKIDKNHFNCIDIGTQTVTMRVEDDFGNFSICASSVKVSDQMSPVAVCVEATVLPLNDMGTADLPAISLDQGSYDNCSANLTYRVNKSAFNCSDLGAPQLVTFTVEDAYFNSQDCEVMITVTDKITPTALCKDSLVLVLNDAGEVEINSGLLDDGSFDNCHALSFQVDPGFFTFANLGFNNATLTVTDASGNHSACTTTIEVVQQPLGAQDPNDRLDIQAYPNPTTGLFNLSISGGRLFDRAELFNASGQLVMQKTFSSPTYEFDMSGLPGGCYFLRVQAGGELRLMKVSVLR